MIFHSYVSLPEGNHAMSMSIHSWEVPFSVAPVVNSSAHRKSFCDFTPWAKLGEVRVDNPAVGCSDVLNIYKETLSGQQLNHIHIFGAGVRSDRWSVRFPCENTIWLWPPKSLRRFFRLRLVKTKHRRRRSTERCASRNMSCAWWPINATASRREVGASRCGTIGWTGFFWQE